MVSVILLAAEAVLAAREHHGQLASPSGTEPGDHGYGYGYT